MSAAAIASIVVTGFVLGLVVWLSIVAWIFGKRPPDEMETIVGDGSLYGRRRDES